jgi:hypothetical protein
MNVFFSNTPFGDWSINIVLIEWMLDLCKDFVFVDREKKSCKPR